MKTIYLIALIWFVASLFIATNKQNVPFGQKVKNFIDALIPPYFLIKKILIGLYSLIAHLVQKIKTK